MLHLAVQVPAVRKAEEDRAHAILSVISQAVCGSQGEIPGEAHTRTDVIVVPEYLDQVLLVRLVMRHGFVPPSDPRSEQLPRAVDCPVQWVAARAL
ncbi:hypothetical protein GCM10009837_18030 [Streptomyces durmitorensis]